MSSYHRAMWSLFQVLLITSLLFSTTFSHGQSSEYASPQGTPSAKTQSSFRTYSFKNIKAADALKALLTINGVSEEELEATGGIVVNERTNSIVFRNVAGEEQEDLEVEEFFKLLDVEIPISANGARITPATSGVAPSVQTFTFSVGFERGESIESLKQRYIELEQQTHELAGKLKQSKSPTETERKELQLAVRKSFEARQVLQRAELADLAHRMQSMQQSIDMRDKLADKVVERRVEDLLNPNLKWDLLAAKDRTLDGHNSESSNGSATTAQSAPETPALTPESSAYLPPSIAPTPISVPYDPGKRPETIIMERIQGEWIAESMISAGKDSLSDYSEPFEVLITGNEMRFKVGDQDLSGPNPMLLVGPKGSFRSIVSADQPMPIDIVMDPNGENREMRSIIACDGTTLSICFADEDESKSGFRPSSFIPGSKVVVIKCHRLTPTVPANKPGAANLSTPQATLDYLHRYSLAHPDGFPAECYTDEALLELSGMMLQNLSMMSAMSQIALQTGGVIGESNGVPVVSDTSPAFHIGVEALLKEHMLPTPPESADKAFELLATLTFGGDSSNPTAAVKVDRRLLRLAAGVLKSPKEFLPAADKLLETFGETAADVTKSQKAAQTQPKADIAINGDEATATFTSSGNVASPSPLSRPRVTKLRRIDGRWLISEILSDQEITQMQSSMSSVMDQLGGAEANFDTPQALLARVDECSKAGSYEEFIALFSDEGVRDLAGCMLMQAVMQTSIDDLSRQLTFGGVAEDEPNFVAFRKVLQRWLPQNVTAAQQEAMGKGLSTIMSSTGGGSPDHAALNEFVISLRESVAGISDHPKFCIEIMQALEKRTKRKFVFFGNADHENEWQISPFSDRAIATLIDGSPGMATTITLQQANGTWRIASLFNERIIEAQPATKSLNFNSIAPESTGSDDEKADPAKAKQSSSLPTKHDAKVDLAVFDWSDLLKLLPESGTVLVMFSHEPDKREQMLPIAEKVAEETSVKLIHLPIDNWRTLFSKEATHFVLMKDRQLIGTKSGLVTEAKLKEFVAQATAWLTPQSIGVFESSLVRVDCYISPGKDNIGSQHGPAIPITLAVVAIDGDEALLFGTEGIAQYLEKGCACVAIVRDDKGKEKQVPIEVVLTGNVPLKKPDALNDDDALVITIPFFEYDKEYIELQEAYDVGSAIYRIRGAHGLTTVKLAPFDSTPQKGERVLAVEFNSSRHHGPILGFQSPFHWQTQQNLSESYSSIYGANIHGAKMFEVLCPTIPAPSSFLFNAHGRLIGTRGLGNLTEKDKTYTALMPYAIHSVLHAGLETIDHAGLKAALKQTLEESTSANQSAKTSSTVEPKYSGHSISWWLDSYWDNAIAIPKTPENIAQEYVASEAIRKLREKPECKAAIEAALAKWFASVEHEVNEVQLTRAAKCFVTAAGPEYQEVAVHYLCKIWSQLPTLSFEKQVERLGEETELNDLLKQLVRNDALAIQFAERLSNGTSSDRSLVTYYLFCSTGLNEKDPKVAELNTWLHHHRELFFPAFSAALKDESEHVRWFSLASLIGLDPKHASTLSTLTSVIESDASTKVRWLAIEMISSKEILSVAKTQNIEVAPLLIKTLGSDTSFDVRYAALGALMAMDKDSELVHKTLMAWARCKDRLQVENALYLMLRNHEVGDRPQSIDELIELLSDSEWGTTVEVKQNSYRWARQYAIANLGQYAAHAHRAIPTLEAELARNNKETLSFATEALDRVRGYCPDLPIEELQGEWEFVAMEKPEGSTPFFDFQASSDQQPASVITITGTQLKLGDRVLAELSHYRTGSRQGIELLLDPEGKKLHCHGRYDFMRSPESQNNADSEAEMLILEVCELHEDSDARQATQQTYEFRKKPVRAR